MGLDAVALQQVITDKIAAMQGGVWHAQQLTVGNDVAADVHSSLDVSRLTRAASQMAANGSEASDHWHVCTNRAGSRNLCKGPGDHSHL